MNGVDTLRSLIAPANRASGAPELAEKVGASHLCVFIRDPELKKFLPAPGFPQRLQKGLLWTRFLDEIASAGYSTATLPSPFTSETVPVSGKLLTETTIAVFLGKAVTADEFAETTPSIIVLGTLYLQEVKTNLAEMRAVASRNAAAESRKLAHALSDVHDQLAAQFQKGQELSDSLRHHQERLDLARRISGIGEWQFDAQQHLMWLSLKAASIFGLEVEGEIKIDEVVSRVMPEDREVFQSAFRVDLKTEPMQSERQLCLRLMDAGAGPRWVEIRSMPFHMADGSTTIIGTCLDITRRVLTEETLVRSEKLAAAGRLAASIAHEINNPLEGLVNLIYIARQEQDLEIIRGLLKQAETEVTRVARVAQRSLAFYRDVNTPVVFDLRTVVEELARLLQPQASQCGVFLQVELPEQSAEINGWPGEIKQVVSNLLINALHASEKSGSVLIRVSRGETAQQIVIADRGHGISAENLRRIFEPFFTTRKESGTGLGLWVTRQLIDKHGGSIQVRSSIAPQRHGTVFKIRLPAVSAGSIVAESETSLRNRWQQLK